MRDKVPVLSHPEILTLDRGPDRGILDADSWRAVSEMARLAYKRPEQCS